MKNNVNIVGCGYIGKKVASLLSAIKINPSCFVLSQQSKISCETLGLKTFQFDLDKNGLNIGSSVKDLFTKSSIAYFAAPQKDGAVDMRMKNFIAMLESLESPPSKIILISTTGVYGDCQGEWIDERRSVNPLADRARRRLSAEMQLESYCEKYQVQCLVLRVPGIYASDKLPIKRISSAEPVVSAEDSGFTNRIHADDLSAFCLEALSSEVMPGIYNCCDGQPSTMNDYFMQVADALGLPRPREISLLEAQKTLSAGMLSYLAESKRISNEKLLNNFKTQFKYKNLQAGLKAL